MENPSHLGALAFKPLEWKFTTGLEVAHVLCIEGLGMIGALWQLDLGAPVSPLSPVPGVSSAGLFLQGSTCQSGFVLREVGVGPCLFSSPKVKESISNHKLDFVSGCISLMAPCWGWELSYI